MAAVYCVRYRDIVHIVKNLEFDKEKIICVDNFGIELYIFRPSKTSRRLKHKYDPKKNIQVWMKGPGLAPFMPNHLRLLIDLNLRAKSRPDLKGRLFDLFDTIFHGSDPEEEIKKFQGEEFPLYLNSLKIITQLAQLLLIEQELYYPRESKFDPPSLFLQGWIRQFIDSPREMDIMCMSVARYQPPKVKYTSKDNKKHKDYTKNLPRRWYLDQ